MHQGWEKLERGGNTTSRIQYRPTIGVKEGPWMQKGTWTQVTTWDQTCRSPQLSGSVSTPIHIHIYPYTNQHVYIHKYTYQYPHMYRRMTPTDNFQASWAEPEGKIKPKGEKAKAIQPTATQTRPRKNFQGGQGHLMISHPEQTLLKATEDQKGERC